MPVKKLKRCISNSLRAFGFLKSDSYLTYIIQNLQRIADYYQNRFITRRRQQLVFEMSTAYRCLLKTEENLRV